MEKSSQDDADINAQRIAALRSLTEKLGYVTAADTSTSSKDATRNARAEEVLGATPTETGD